MYHVLYDGSIEDERNYAAMGGQAEEIRRFLKDHYRDGMTTGDALRLGVRALTVTQNKTLTERDLEVAVLDRGRERRKFRRIADVDLRDLLDRGARGEAPPGSEPGRTG
jgi:proteasome alpha subunit